MTLALLFIIVVTPFLGALATFFTGFGLNTILVPVFMIYFDAPLAVLMAGIVHLCNNILKVALTARSINWNLFRNFGLPALLFAFIGAQLLNTVKDTIGPLLPPIFGAIFILFALLELFNWKLSLKGSWAMRIGGSLSGFFGGLSGHQGALRSAFLTKVGLSKEAFIATGVLIACMIDISRMSVYFTNISKVKDSLNLNLLIVATLAAFIGVYFGNKLVKKITITTIQKIVALMIIIFAIALGFGIV